MSVKIVLAGITEDNVELKEFVKRLDLIELAHPGLSSIIRRLKRENNVPAEAHHTVIESDTGEQIHRWSWVEITID